MFNNFRKLEKFEIIAIFVLVVLLAFSGSYSNLVQAETVTEAQRASGLYQAHQAWLNRIVPSIAIAGKHDNLSEYAAKCKTATGIDVPKFSCSKGREVPGQGDIPATKPNATHCDQPNVLNSLCDPGSKFQVLPGRTADAVAVAHCRKVGLLKDGELYNDIAVIQYNKKNGALCFYQALTNLPGDDIPPPSAGDVTKWKDGKAHWMSPEDTEAIGCTGCHDNGGFIRSRYLAQLKPPGHALPTISDGYNNLNTPAKYVGLDYKTNKSWSITTSPALGDSGCEGCHRLAISNRCVPAFLGNPKPSCTPGIDKPNGTAANFSLVATAVSQVSKNPHSAASPIWMRPGQTSHVQGAEDSAKIYSECAKGFWNSGFVTAPPGCVVKPLGEPLPDADDDGIDDNFDNCPHNANPDQLDTDSDKQGDVCDDDDDNDSCKDAEDQHPIDANPVVAKLPSVPNSCPNDVIRVFEGNDSDRDGIPNCKDSDDDNDSIPDDQDTCPTVKPDGNILSPGCGFGITPCPVIKVNLLGVCFGTTCIEDFRAKLDWVVDVINPPIEVTIFDRFWMEAGNLYISKGSLNGNQNPLQAIVNQLSIAPDAAPAGWFRLSIWSRNTSHSQSQLRAVVAEYAPSQISFSGNNFTGSSIRLSLPQSPNGKLLIENSDKTEPTMIDKRVEDDYSTYLSAILILAVVAGITLIAIKINR